MIKKILFALIGVLIIAAGAWYWVTRPRPVPIQELLGKPGQYGGKELTIEGEITDRTAFFGSPKFYKIKDKSGEIIVVTRKGLPEIRSTVTVKGRINEAYPLGSDRIIVFEEKAGGEEQPKTP